MQNPTISVVSLTWNSARFVDPMLGTLLADADESNVPIEVIVVDNGSTDETLSLVRNYREQHHNIHVVPLSTNHGTT